MQKNLSTNPLLCILQEFGRTVELTNRLAKGIHTQLNRSKPNGITGKGEYLPEFPQEEKFTF